MVVSSSALFDLRELRRDVEGLSASGAAFEGLVLRPPLDRFEGCGVDFSSIGSDGGLSSVSACSPAGAIGTDPDEDMAALPLAFLVLVARRLGVDSGLSAGSGLGSRADVFRLRDAGAGGGCVAVGGAAGGEVSLVLADWRLCERVTLDDMRF